jgi:ribosome recycling factor
MSIIDANLVEFNKAVEHYRHEISTLKTGRVTPMILDNIRVEAYGVKNPLNQLGSVTIDGRSLLIQPWDKSVIKEIEKAIVESALGLSPANEGERIRITIPPLTEETRKEIAKLLHQKAEQAKVALRQIRDKVKEEIMEAEKNKEFGEDEKFSLLEELDKKVGEFNNQIKAITEEKEEEIMTV